VCDEPLLSTTWMVKLGWIVWSGRRRNRVNVAALLRVILSVRTWPVCTFSAAMVETVPWRMYSNSRRRGRPGRWGRSGCLREGAVMPGFLVHRRHDRVRWVVPVDRADLCGPGEEVRVGRAGQPAADPVWCQVGRGQDPADV
jgi:hypothetical protein